MDQFTVFSPRKINTDSFENQNTMSKLELDSLISKGSIEVYTLDALKKYHEEATSGLMKSESDEEKEQIKKALDAELATLHPHRVDGVLLYIRAKNTETFEKGEELISLDKENDIIKSNLSDMFSYGDLAKLQFSKKGSEIKESVQQKITSLEAEKADIQSKMTAILGKLEVTPSTPISDYYYSGLKDKVGEIMVFPYPQTCYSTSNSNSMSDDKVPYASSQEEADLCNTYNFLAQQYISRCVDVHYLTIFMNNLEEKKSYTLTIPQLVQLGIEKGDTEDDNDIEKAEGSRGGKVIGHTKSGKPIYATTNAKHESKYSSQDHTDAAYAHLDHAKKLAKDDKKEDAERHSDKFDSHMATAKHKKMNEDMDKEDSKK